MKHVTRENTTPRRLYYRLQMARAERTGLRLEAVLAVPRTMLAWAENND
jgi:hypothetical protein